MKDREKLKAQYMVPLACLLVCCVIMLLMQMIQMLKGGNPDISKVDEGEPIRGLVFSYLLGPNLNKMDVVKKLCKETDVEIEFIHKESMHQERVARYITDKDTQVDFIMGGNVDGITMYRLINNGLLLPLNDLIRQYAPNIQALIEKDSFFRESITQGDGNIYSLPKYYETRPYSVNQYLYINKEWLERLGLKVPTTTEEFYEVLKAFKESDPNGNNKSDEIPFTFSNIGSDRGMDLFIGSFGVLNQRHYMMEKNDETLFIPLQEGYKEAMIYLRRLYEEELLDAQIFTQGNSVYTGKGKMEDVILGAFIGYGAEDMVGVERAKAYIPIEPLKGPGGEQMWLSNGDEQLVKNQFMITRNSQNPEKIIRWVDQFFDPDNSKMCQWGSSGEVVVKEEGEFVFKDPDNKEGYWELRLKHAPGLYGPGIVTEEVYKQGENSPTWQFFKDTYKRYEPYLYEDKLCLRDGTREEIDRLVELYKELDKAIRGMEMRWLSGKRDIEQEWEVYKETLKNMGALEYEELYREIDARCLLCNREICCSK